MRNRDVTLLSIRTALVSIVDEFSHQSSDLSQWDETYLAQAQDTAVQLFQCYLMQLPDNFTVSLERLGDDVGVPASRWALNQVDDENVEWVLRVEEQPSDVPLWRMFQYALNTLGLSFDWTLSTAAPVPIAAVLSQCENAHDQVLEVIRWLALKGCISRRLLPDT